MHSHGDDENDDDDDDGGFFMLDDHGSGAHLFRLGGLAEGSCVTDAMMTE
jgi:hypothetical protein